MAEARTKRTSNETDVELETGAQPRSPTSGSSWRPWFLRVLAVVVVGCVLVLLLRALPTAALVDAATRQIQGLGVWGPIVFVAVYAAATLAFVPGVPLTVAAGGIFGLLGGTAAVSAGSTLGAAGAFLIARHLARERVERRVSAHPRFAAIDDAIRHGGWRIVAMLRLSPAVPFNLQNYLYGVTAIRFWPAIVTSWLCMLPGTFLYVYIGHLGRTGIAAAAADRPAGAGHWTLRIVGLLATLGATFYITRLAKEALNAPTESDDDPDRSRDEDTQEP